MVCTVSLAWFAIQAIQALELFFIVPAAVAIKAYAARF